MGLLEILFGKKQEPELTELLEELSSSVSSEESTTDQTVDNPSYFTDNELKCKCGCGKCKMNEDFLSMLNKARHIAGKGWKVNSAYRCPAHNKAVGGVAGSSHTKGCAVDISAPTSSKKFEIINAALAAGFTRIGVGANFVHLDTDDKKASNVVWVY